MRKIRFFIIISLVLLSLISYSKPVFANNLGKKVETKSNKRFVVLFPQALPFVFMIDAQNGLVGYPGMGASSIPYFSGNLILTKWPDFRQKVIDVGYPFGPSIEKIVALKPAFVVNVNMQSSNEQFERLKIPVVAFSGCFGSFNDLFKSIKKLGEATNHIKQAQSLIDYYQRTINFVQSHIRGIKSKPKVLYLSYQGPRGNKLTAGGQFDALVNDIIQKSGGESVSRNVAGMFGQISKEDIIKWNPDFIFLGAGGSQETIQNIYKDKDLRFISAVVHKKIYLVPRDGNENYSNYFSPQESALGILWCAKTLHLNHFKNLNLETEAFYYYKKFWDLKPNKVRIKWLQD